MNNKHPIKEVFQHLDLQLVDSDFKQTVSVLFWLQSIMDKVAILTRRLISGPLKWAILCKQFNQIEKWSVDQFETKTSDFVTSVKKQTSVLDIYVKQMRFSQNVDRVQESLNKESKDMWMRLKKVGLLQRYKNYRFYSWYKAKGSIQWLIYWKEL